MRRRTEFGTMLAAIALLAGCQQRSPALAPTSAARAALEVNLRFPRQLQSVAPYSRADVKHLRIEVFAVSDGTETPVGETVDLLPASFSDPVTLSGLKPDTLYRLRAYAYASSDTSRLISNTVDGSSVDVDVTDDDRLTIATLSVRLIPTAKPIVNTFAGNPGQGSANGSGTAASFYGPVGLAFDASGKLYVGDRNNDEIREITPAGVVSTFAGSTTAGSADGTATAASFHYPTDLACDASGNLYVADSGNHEIREITPAGVVSTFAGSTTAGSADGTGTAASFSAPAGLAFDARGNLYVADRKNNEIRAITPAGIVTTLAGSPIAGSADGTGTAAAFCKPTGVAVGKNGDLYVADSGNMKIRRISPSGVVTTLAGTGASIVTNGPAPSASFESPRKLAFDADGHLFVSDYTGFEVRELQ